MSSTALLTIYCAAILLASMAGGWLPTVLRLDHRRTQIMLSFVAGVMLGMGLLHLLPHGFYELGSIDRTVAWTLGGFLAMFFLERFFHFHQHDSADAMPADPGHQTAAHEHEHGHAHSHANGHAGAHGSSHAFSWSGAAVGMTLHSMMDGVALAAAVAAERAHGDGDIPYLAGLGIFLAVLLHKPFDSMAIGTLMGVAGRPARQRLAVNALFALTIPLGVLLFHFGMNLGPGVLGSALAFAAGAFLCITTSDLLPELQFHSHDRVKLSCALLLGIAIAWAMVLFESSGHDAHQHGGAHGHGAHGSHAH